MPLTRWAKLLMLTQPTVSILTLILAAARAVNILRSTGPCAARKTLGWQPAGGFRLVSQDVAGWIVGLAAGLTSVILAA